MGFNENENSYSSPIQVGSDTTWNLVFAGKSCTWAIKTDGTLWGWGENSGGNLCQNNRTNYSSPVQIGSNTDWNRVSSTQANGLLALTNT